MSSGVYDRSKAKWIKRRPDGTYIPVFEDKKRRAKALDLYLVKGWSIAKVANYFECANSAVQRLLESENLTRKKLRVLSKKELSIIKHMYCVEKASLGEITKKIKTTFDIIKKCIKRLKLPNRKKSETAYFVDTRSENMAAHVNAVCNSAPDYRHRVRALAWRIWRKYQEIIDPEGEYLFNSDKHLDHIISIHDGWKNKIPLCVIAHPANIRVVDKNINLQKGKNSSLEVSELLSKIAEFEKVHGKVFDLSKKVCTSVGAKDETKKQTRFRIKLNNRKK